MMRNVSLLVALFLVMLAIPAQAGTVTVTDGQGSWQSTKCTPPQPPVGMATNPEEAADDLNAQIALHNQYVPVLQAYMTCISQEAQADADAASQTVTRVAQGIIQQTLAQSNASSLRLQGK